jgi:large subunit ribosomal protein L10
MAKTRSLKEALLQDYKALLADTAGFIAVDGKSIDNVTVTELKKKLKAGGNNITVIKNTVFKIALEEGKFPVEASAFDGQTAIITYAEDPTVVAKAVKELQDEGEELELELLQARYGVIDGEYVDAKRVMQLALIPSREVLLSQLLGSMTAPVKGFMNAVTGNARGFVQVLKQISEKEEA